MSKGSRRERELVQLYQRAGYATYRPATVQYGENDVFGLFDVLAVSPNETLDRPHGLRAIQVKSNGARGIEAWQRHTWLFRRNGMVTYYAIPYDNEGWRLIYVTSHKRVDVVDERDRDCAMGEGIVEYLRGES